jgi:hypothetical protein
MYGVESDIAVRAFQNEGKASDSRILYVSHLVLTLAVNYLYAVQLMMLLINKLD